MLVPGPALSPGERCDLVAVRAEAGWEVWADGEQPPGLRRHAIEALTLRSVSRLQVALLEDDARAAEAMVEAFRPLDIEAEPHASADSLLATIGRRRFDAYVLDWLLPDGDAARVVAAIRLHRAHVPVVVVTGALKADSEMERSLLELSVRWNFSTLDKPVRPMNLANAIKQLAAAARAA
jgi:DNA-binding response OmpR family regulator